MSEKSKYTFFKAIKDFLFVSLFRIVFKSMKENTTTLKRHK